MIDDERNTAAERYLSLGMSSPKLLSYSGHAVTSISFHRNVTGSNRNASLT